MDQQQYQDWLDSRETILKKLKSKLDSTLSEKLDFSPASLQLAGEYLVTHFDSLDSLYQQENRDIHMGMSTYAFEVFRRNCDFPH
ncbi:hypothetical protein [Aliikangiella maris]|uniref:Uncharacterized protein n=1 Tax=Aliikangiella maris TaxID=3162458 RepID=A0ABV2C0E3_9GAMM